jgi:hypothetical protein
MRSVLRVQVLACCSLVWLSGCSRCGQEPGKGGGAPPTQAPAQGEPRAASSASPEQGAPAAASPGQATVLAELPSGDVREVAIAEQGGGAAYVVQEGAAVRVIHGDHASAAYSQVAHLVLSADGRRSAFQAQRGDGSWRMVVDGAEGQPFLEVTEPLFSRDGAHLVYQAKDGDGWRLVVDGAQRGAAFETQYEAVAFAGDGSRLVFLEGAVRGWGKLVTSDLALARRTVVEPAASSPLVSADGARVAAVSSDANGQRAITFAADRPERVERGPTRDGIYHLNFGPDGATLAYVADRGDRFSVVLDGKEEPLPAGDELITVPVVRPGGGAAIAGVISNGGVVLREFLAPRGAREGPYQHVEGPVYAPDGRGHACAVEKDQANLVVVNGHEGPPFDKVVTPAFTPDGRFVVYRARKDGKRFVVVADARGSTVRQGAPFEQVFPVRFTADGKAIAYGAKDGHRLVWRVEPL